MASWGDGRRRIGRKGGSEERPAIFFSGPEEFRSWLEANHETATELWMGLNQRHVADRGLTWAEAVPEALAFGWIDSMSERIDGDARRQRWTPRRPGSTWSKIKVDIVQRLLAEGRMAPAGIAAFEARRADRIGVYSYERDTRELSPEHAAVLAADPCASAFWAETTPSYRRVCVHWVTSAKQPATRERRIAQLADDCAHGRLIKGRTYGTPPTRLERAAAAARDAQRDDREAQPPPTKRVRRQEVIFGAGSRPERVSTPKVPSAEVRRADRDNGEGPTATHQ